ncbi:MAG: serine O-acetyltransferase [Armatimonadota bacterium]|nr:serine O-acetyltransferase [bacterium]
MFDNAKADVLRFTRATGLSWWRYVLTVQGAWAILEYRYSYWMHHCCRNRPLRMVLKAFGFFWHKSVQIATGISIDPNAEIGPEFLISHFGGIFIAGQVKMGRRCTVHQGITIGWSGRGDKKGCPVIGDRVYIGAGAKVLGKITIGNDVAIGANAVVTKDVPDNAVVVGIPARVVNFNGSHDFIEWTD